MAFNRRDILSNLKTILEGVTGITTVVRSYGLNAVEARANEGMDISQYASTDLPLIDINEPMESADEELTSRRSVMFLETYLRVWFVDWNDQPQTTYETLMKRIRDAIGNNFTVNSTATACWVISVSAISGELPLFYYDIGLRLKYYLDQTAT
jgi:ERCC4-related helicase